MRMETGILHDDRVTPLTPASENLDAILALNNDHAAELSLLTADSLAALLRTAFHARRIGQADAFLIGFDETAEYDSPNFLWFRARFSRFAYVDRVAVTAQARSKGLARRLYADFFAAARAAGRGFVCCEVNQQPPNPASDTFHAALGFEPAGTAELYGGARTVRYLVHRLNI